METEDASVSSAHLTQLCTSTWIILCIRELQTRLVSQDFSPLSPGWPGTIVIPISSERVWCLAANYTEWSAVSPPRFLSNNPQEMAKDWKLSPVNIKTKKPTQTISCVFLHFLPGHGLGVLQLFQILVMQYWRMKNLLPRKETEISISNPHPPLAAGARAGRMKQNSSFFPSRKYMMTTSLLKYLPYWAQVEFLAEQDRSSTRLPWQSKTNCFFTDVSAQTSSFTLDTWGNPSVKWAVTEQK